MLRILACDSLSFPPLPQFLPIPVMLCFDKPEVLATGVSALDGVRGGSGPAAQERWYTENLKSPG